MDSPIHELGGRSSEVGSMSRVELPPGARPFVPERDLLTGGPSLQRRHLLARTALLRRLLVEPMVVQAFDDWTTRYGLRQPLETLTTRLDTLASEAGLSHRTALFSPESTRDASTQQAVQQAREVFWNGVTGNKAELEQDAHRLAGQLVTALGLSARCVPWVALELLSWFFDSLTAQIQDRTVTRRYTDEPFGEVVAVRIDPRMSPRQRVREMREQMAMHRAAERKKSPARRMPKGGGQHIGTYVGWLVRNGLHGVSVRALARALSQNDRGGSPSPDYDARRRIQYGITRARTWLAAVAARTPVLSPAQPKRGTPRKRSKRRRRRRSAPG